MIGGAGVRRYENRLSAEFSAERVISRLQPRERLTPAPPYHRKKTKNRMKKQRIIELAVKVIVAALTAFLTAIGTTSCMGYGPF